MQELLAFLSRSWVVIPGKRWRISVDLWILLLAGLSVGSGLANGTPWSGLAKGSMLILAMIIHAAGHVVGCLLVRAMINNVTASAMIDQRDISHDMSPRSLMVIGISGPLASLVCWLLLEFVMPVPAQEHLALFAAFLTFWSKYVFLFNVLACAPFDGRVFWKGLLWPVLGQRLSAFVVLALGYVSCAILVWYAVSLDDIIFLLFVILSLIATLQDHRQIREGTDPIIGFPLSAANRGSWWSRWQARRAERVDAQIAAELADEQQTLDRLLAKVSEQGLPSLTTGERRELERISKRQKARAANG